MMRSLPAIACMAVLCLILTLGLWPFHAPVNQVYWLGNRNGIRFGDYGTLLSAGAFGATAGDPAADLRPSVRSYSTTGMP